MTSEKPAQGKPLLKVQICLFSYGGVYPMTHACLERDVLMAINDQRQDYALCMSQAFNDALIDRCRATAMEQFLATDCDVLVSLDHDLSWEPGDLLRIATKAHETKAIVGAAVAKRAKGQGIASAIVEAGAWRHGSDRLVATDYLGAAFTAVPRCIAESVMSKWDKTVQGFRPSFLPCTWPHRASANAVTMTLPLRRSLKLGDIRKAMENVPDDRYASIHDSTIVVHETEQILIDYLSEDWAFCRRAIELGWPVFVDLQPRVAHHGTYAYTVADAFAGVDHTLMQRPPSFSLLHATRGRRDKALAAHKLWMERASGCHPIEYIFSCDSDDPQALEQPPDDAQLVVGDNRGNVDAYNRAAYRSTGDVLIQVHDDVEPPVNWDVAIAEKIGDHTRPVVLRVSDGLPASVNAHQPGLLTVLVGTRAWFESCGYFWHPSIVSVFCDDHMTALAEKEGVIVEARDIVFKHHWQGPARDETQLRSYRPRNWEIGKAALEQLKADGLVKEPELWRHL